MTQEGLVTAVIDFVTFPVDYYNSLLCGITDCNINRLQQIQNGATRVAKIADSIIMSSQFLQTSIGHLLESVSISNIY